MRTFGLLLLLLTLTAAPALATDPPAAPAAHAPAADLHAAPAADPHHAPKPAMTADAAMRALIEGNARFVAGMPARLRQDDKRLAETAQGQAPFAIVVSCSDSRVPPEILFDQGIGDLFIIRTAGHVVDDVALGSIEYAVEHIGCPILVVLGHERCGAVKAAVAGGALPGHLPALGKAISPAVEMSRGKEGDHSENAMRSHVGLTVHALKTGKPILEEFVKSGKLKVVGARYDLDEGRVDWIIK